MTLFDFGQSPEGTLYLAMELLSGRSLAAELEEEPHFESAICVPLGPFGIFQAVSEEEGEFNVEDSHMLELLLNLRSLGVPASEVPLVLRSS